MKIIQAYGSIYKVPEHEYIDILKRLAEGIYVVIHDKYCIGMIDVDISDMSSEEAESKLEYLK